MSSILRKLILNLAKQGKNFDEIVETLSKVTGRTADDIKSAANRAMTKTDDATTIPPGMGAQKKQMSKVGQYEFPSEHTAKGMEVKDALVKKGMVPEGTPLQVGGGKPLETKASLVGKKASDMPTVKKAAAKEDLVGKEDFTDMATDFPQLRGKGQDQVLLDKDKYNKYMKKKQLEDLLGKKKKD